MTDFQERYKTICARQNRVSELRWDIFDLWFGFFRKTPQGKRLLCKALNIGNQLELDKKVLLGRTHQCDRSFSSRPPWYCIDCRERFDGYPLLSNRLCPAFIDTLNMPPNYEGRPYRPKIYSRSL